MSWAAVYLLICRGGLWDGKCLTLLEKSRLARDAVGWLHLPPDVSLPSLHASDALGRLWMVFGLWSSQGRAESRALLSSRWNVALCIQRLSSHPPLPYSSCLSSLWHTHSGTLPRHEEIYQGHTKMRAGSAGAQLSTAVPPSARWQTLPLHAGAFFHAIVCLSRFFGS